MEMYGNFTIKRMANDENCLFRFLALLLDCDENLYILLRGRTVRFM
jgi:hypothetical protein